MTDKVIFLDFDGVMDTAFYDNYLTSNGLPNTDKYGPAFDPECVKALGQIVEKTGAKIVVTSTWKDFMSLDDMKQMWKDRNLPGEIIDMTPSISQHRGDEIDAWLANNKETCSYVIIDDMPFTEFNSRHLSRFIAVNAYTGLDETCAERTIDILNGGEQEDYQ